MARKSWVCERRLRVIADGLYRSMCIRRPQRGIYASHSFLRHMALDACVIAKTSLFSSDVTQSYR